MEGHINTYGGMDKDTAYDSLKQSSYIDAVDIRISTDKGESQGAFTNMKGNQEIFQIRDESAVTDPFHPWTASSPEIIGYGTIRNSIVLFVADDTGTKGWIYEVKYDPATREILPGYPKTVYYNDNLNFKKEWPIEALGRYENASTQKIYWTDYNNFFRTLNIVDPDLVTFPVENIDIFPSLEYTQPILQSVGGGGQLNSGMYQIAYRLITSDGKETLISPPSNMIHIVTASDYDSVPKYVGEPEKVNTGKSIEITVDTTNYVGDFEKIEFFALYYENGTATPAATSIEITAITGNSVTLLYTGAESTIFDIDLFTFTTKNFAFKTFKTVTQKDNYLVGANIKSSTIDVQDLLEPGDTFTGLTKRYNDVASGKNPPLGTDLEQAFNVEFNKDKHWDITWQLAANQYKYKADGITLGGEGPNISYEFHLERMTVDVETQPGFHNIGGNVKYTGIDNHDLDDGYGERPNPSFANNASPNISGLLKGYKRGETYRFGIIFYTLKGEATYVEYIGDIKFPDISEKDGANNRSNSPYFPLSTMGTELPVSFGNIAVGFNLGIKFTLDFTSCPSLLNKIESYQIVRLPRTDIDKRRLCQGIINPLAHFRIVDNPANPTPEGYDFRIDASENVVHQNNYVLGLDPSSTFAGGGTINLLEFDSFQYFLDVQNNDCDVSGIPAANRSAGTTRAQHISFYSPEISYASAIGTNITDIATNLGNNPCLLMTGYYSFEANTADPPPYDYIEGRTTTSGVGPADALGPKVVQLSDVKQKLLRTLPVTFNSIENIKKLNNSSYFDMRDSTNVYLDTKTASWGTPSNPNFISAAPGPSMTNSPSYMRNYYAFPGGLSLNHTLNHPELDDAVIARAGSNISGLTKEFFNDPLNPTTTYSIPGTDRSEVDFFHIFGNTFLPDIPNNARINLLDKDGNTGVISRNRGLPMGDIVIPKNEVYGGSTRDALEANNFIPASPVIDKTELTPIVFGGDIYITMSHIQKGMTEFNSDFYDNGASNDYDSPFTNTLLLVTESTINTNLSHGSNTTTGVEFTWNSEQSPYFRQEDNNDLSNYGKKNPGEDYFRFYAYNNVFSKENREVLFFVKPSNLTELSLTNDVRAYLSSVKTNGETIDSWTKFGINDFYDVDDHGPINKIINFKDNVYFLQDQGTGVYAINREAVTTTDDGVPTELGTSKGWGKHQYYSKENGSIHQWAVAVTDRGIYFFDAIHRKIFQLSAAQTGMSNAPLSEVKGMHSYLQELGPGVFLRKEDTGDNPVLNNGAHIGVDEINDEIIFTFLSSSPRYTPNDNFKSIVFDEVTGTFSTRLSITPKMWINNGNTLLTTTLDTGVRVWAHNIGNWGEFYGTQTGCELTLVINPKADINKVLRFLEFNSIVRDDDKVIDRTKTITGFKIATETQASDSIYETTPDSLTRIKRRFDKWRIKLPRNVNSTSQKGRFRSTHFLLTLYFDNTYNKELIMNRLVSYYDPQIF